MYFCEELYLSVRDVYEYFDCFLHVRRHGGLVNARGYSLQVTGLNVDLNLAVYIDFCDSILWDLETRTIVTNLRQA